MNRFDRILVIRSGAIGDFIVTLPVIQLLRQAYAKSRLAVVAKNRVRGLVKRLVDEFLDIDGRLLLPFFHGNLDRSCDEFRYLNTFDLVVSYLGAEGQVSTNLLALSEAKVINADPLPPEGYDHHVTEFLLRPLSEIVDVSSAPPPSVAISEEDRMKAETFLSVSRHTTSHWRSRECSAPPAHTKDCGVPSPRPGRKVPPAIAGDRPTSIRMAFYEAVNSVDGALPWISRSLIDITTDCTHRMIEPSAAVIAVHPGSGSRRKVIPARTFCQAVEWIQAQYPRTTVMTVEGEADEEDVSTFERGLKTRFVRVRKENLLEVAAILSQASLFMGNDSGIAHLAAAVGVPSVVVFQASDPVVWAPRGKQVWVTNADSFAQVVQEAACKALGSGKESGRER
jgi:hypothetical protein